MVICSKPFDVTLAFTWTFLQNELHTSFSFQGRFGMSLLSFHQGTALTLLSLPFPGDLCYPQAESSLATAGGSREGTGWEQSAVGLLFGAPWDSGSWTKASCWRERWNGHCYLQKKPFLSACREQGQPSHCPLAQITDLMKNFPSCFVQLDRAFLTLDKCRKKQHLVFYTWKWLRHQKMPKRNPPLQANQERIRKIVACGPANTACVYNGLSMAEKAPGLPGPAASLKEEQQQWGTVVSAAVQQLAFLSPAREH